MPASRRLCRPSPAQASGRRGQIPRIHPSPSPPRPPPAPPPPFRPRLRFRLLFLVRRSLAACGSPPPPAAPAPAPLVLVSIDGFRADYLDAGLAPNLSTITSEGVRAQWINPSYPSLTFPNHYSIVTGLRPDHPGKIGRTSCREKVCQDGVIQGVAVPLQKKNNTL